MSSSQVENNNTIITKTTTTTLCYRRRRHHITQEALLSQRGRTMLRVCIASIQNVKRSLLLLVVLASDILLCTIKFISVLFGVFIHAAAHHKQTFDGTLPTVRSTLHGRW